MIEKATESWKSDHPRNCDSDCPLPLIRLKVDYSDGYTTVSPFRIGQTFINSVANPKDVIAFFRRRQQTKSM